MTRHPSSSSPFSLPGWLGLRALVLGRTEPGQVSEREWPRLRLRTARMGFTTVDSRSADIEEVQGPRIHSNVHHVQANLPAANTTTHPMRNRKIENAKSACFLNSLRPSLIRVVRRKKIERTKRKSGIAAARKAMILKVIAALSAP
jgi:hypothetical protein